MTVRRTGSQGQRVLSGQGTCQLRAEGPEGPAQSVTGRALGGEWWCQVAEAHPALSTAAPRTLSLGEDRTLHRVPALGTLLWAQSTSYACLVRKMSRVLGS